MHGRHVNRASRQSSQSSSELGIDLVAGSIAERVEGRDKLANTSVHVGPDGEVQAVYRKIHMFDVEIEGTVYRESETEEPGDEIAVSRTADGVELGLTICYDLRFPELFRHALLQGAEVFALGGKAALSLVPRRSSSAICSALSSFASGGT